MAVYLTIRQVAKRIPFHVNTIRRYCQEGRFPKALLIGNRWLIPEEGLKVFIERYGHEYSQGH